jgi:predicted branched-subunit amino acid permease
MSPRRTAALRGFRASAPFAIVMLPFGILFGVIATESGLTLPQTIGFSVLVVAGAAQFAAVQMMADNAPVLVIIATALAVNLRMAMYSAALTPHLGTAPGWLRATIAYVLTDQTFAVAAVDYDRRPAQSPAEKAAFFFGSVLPVCPVWYLSTALGAQLGTAIPPALSIDFAVPLTFIAIVAPLLRSPAHIAAAVVSVALALGLAGLPYNTGLLLAAAGAMATGALTEIWLERGARA